MHISSPSSISPARFNISSTPHIRLFKTQAKSPPPLWTSSCLPIQYFAPDLCTVSKPFYPPKFSLPPSHQGFHDSTRPCKMAITPESPEDLSCSSDNDGAGIPWGCIDNGLSPYFRTREIRDENRRMIVCQVERFRG